MLSLPNELARRVLDATPDAMIIVDDSGSIRFANQQASALFGLSHDELIGKPVDDLIPERFRSRHSSLRREYSSNPRPRPMGVGLSLFGRRRDAAEFPIEISLTPIEAEGQRLFVAAIRDVTDRKRVEALLDAQLEDLRRLHGMGTRLLKATELPRMLEDVLDATVAMQQADFGSIQLYDPGTGALKVMAHRGFSADCLKYFASIDRDNPSAAGRALRSGKRVIIEDVEEDIVQDFL